MATVNNGSSGRAGFYDLRYSTSPVRNTNWGDAVRITGVTGPKPRVGRVVSPVLDRRA